MSVPLAGNATGCQPMQWGYLTLRHAMSDSGPLDAALDVFPSRART